MKHWQYTDIPSVCQQCGYKTCSLPTFKRHVKHCSVSTSTLGPEDGVITQSHEGPAGVAPLESSSCDFSAVDENHVSHMKLCHPYKVKTGKMNEECSFTGSVVLNDGKPVAGQSIPAEDEPLENDITTSEAKTNDEKALVAADVAETSGLSSETKPEVSGKKPSRKSLVADAKCESRKASPRTNRRSADKMASPDESRKPSQMSHEPKVLVVEGHALFCCMLCDFLSSDEKTTRSHIKCCSERAKKYYCSKCDFSCDDKLVLVKHRLQHNVSESGQKTIYSCLECLYKTPLKKNFERHRACHSSAAAVKCNFCSYSSTGESAVRRHISTYHCFPDGPVDENAKALDLENEEVLPAVEAHSLSPTKTPQKSTKEKPIPASSTLKSGSRDKKLSKQSSPSETKNPRSIKISHVQKDIKKNLKTPKTPKSDKSEKLVKTRDSASDDPSPSGVEEKELEENFEVDGVTDIVWSCYYCKLDFKRRCDMEDHTQAEHSINLKDCVMYSLEKGASDVSLYELEQDNAADVPPLIPEADVNGLTQLHCDLCGFKGRRLSDLKRHFRLKHCARENGVTAGKKSSKRPQENSTLVQNKKLKSVDSSSSSEGSTILAKLLQNDDPNYVYKPSMSSGDCVDRVKKTEAKLTLESPDRKKSIAKAVDSSEEIPIQMKVPDEGRVAEAPKFSGENCVQNPNSSSPGEDEPDMEVSYLTRLMCNYCGYLGNNPAEVERHTKIHTGEKNYWCTCCDYKTIWKCDIKKHLEKFHPKEMDTPERLRSLLHGAFRPDGKHTAEELGYRKMPRKDKGENSSDGSTSPGLKKSHLVNLKCKKDVDGMLNSSEKLLNKAKKNLLLQKVLQPKSTDGDEGRELNSGEMTVTTPVVVDVEKERAPSSASEIATPVMKPPCQKLPRKQTDRCRPFKCSACGKRSNWKWDLKKHINDQHPDATIITLNKEEAQKTFAEMLRLHQEKLRLAGHAPGSRRIRIVTAQDQSKPVDQASETTPASADNVEATGGKMLSPRKPSLLTGRSILKGMVDLQKLKRFKCSGCIYRSNFRGDISRHIRSRHSSIRCSVIVMPADLATASLRSYESRWSMRKIDPSVVVESSAGAPAGSHHMDVVQNLGGEALANHEDFGEDGNDNKWRLGQKLKQIDSTSLIGKRAVGGGNGRKNGTDAEEGGETIKRREKTSQVEEDDLKYCTVCPYVTEKSDVLKLHMSYHQPQARNGYSCTFCPYFVNTERLLHHHLQLHMSKETLAAQRSEITHTTKNSTSFDSKYICEFCPYVSKLRSNYWAHRKNHFEKPDALFKCGSCQYWTKDQRHLSQHTKLHEKSYFPKMLLPPPNNEQKQDSNNGCCRCVFAENNGDERFRCGETLKCPYCSYAIPSLRLLRQHMIFHVSFTDAVKNLFFHKKFDGADDYLFVHCKNRPLEDDDHEIASKENVFPSEPRHLFPFGSASNELLGDSSVESGFLLSNAFSRGPDDAISVHSIDTDLPELDRFSSGNSDILDRRVSPVFLEAVLMENIQEFSDIPLDETVSVVELPESSGTTPLNEAVAVVELSLREFLCGGKKFSLPDARHLNEPGNEVVWLQEEVEPMEVQVVTAEESEDIADEGVPFDEALDSTVVSECQLVLAQKGSSKSDENISGEKLEVVAEPGISTDGSLVTHANAFPSLETVETVTGLLSKDGDGFDGMSSYEGIRVEDNTDKMLKSSNELSSSGDSKHLSGEEIGLDSKLEELQMVEKNNVTPSESDNNTAADSATRESPSTPENKTSNDVPVNGRGVLEHAPTSRSVYYTARGISLESSRPSPTETDKQVGNTFDCEASLTDVCPIFHKDGFKEGCENTLSDDDAAVKRCDYEVDYFRSIGLVKVKFM